MKAICLYFQVHQPYRLRTYRFFDIGADSNYYDEYQNRFIMRRVAHNSYLPTNEILLRLIEEHKGAFKVTFSISGMALDQFEQYAPEVIESYQRLAATGSVEFCAETYAHSLVALKSKDEFKRQVEKHAKKIEQLFGQKPTAFRNTELVYSNEIGSCVYDMGYKTVLAEGAKHVLGWKSPNYVYRNIEQPKLKVLLRNFALSDDIAFRFSNQGWIEWPLTAQKYANWVDGQDEGSQVLNLFMDYETFGEHQKEESGILDFLKSLPGEILNNTKYRFATVSEAAEKNASVDVVDVPNVTSWADEERDLSAWLGNELQDEAFSKLYAIHDYLKACDDEALLRDWDRLQTSDHFYYMCTKWFSDGDVHKYFNPYPTPYEAFINYMNVLSDFKIRAQAYYNLNLSVAELAPVAKIAVAESAVKEEISKESIKKSTRPLKGDTTYHETIRILKELSVTRLRNALRGVDAEKLALAFYHIDKETEEYVISKLGPRAKEKYDFALSQFKGRVPKGQTRDALIEIGEDIKERI